nr:hypothetical protein [uncultured Deefgea sp.]
MTYNFFLSSICFAILSGLTHAAATNPAEATNLPAKDAYGCVGEEGYSWCVKLKQCVRPSKILIENNLELSAENFHEFCQTKLK